MLARVNPTGECLFHTVDAPRPDRRIPGVGQDKINSAYAVAAPPAIETVRELTGQPVHHFVMVDYTGFEKAVDAMGGVFIDVTSATSTITAMSPGAGV
jgi:anionic cell wall polymer biosynthesis LytR-Cps2A-Psr (LCP) family protein